MFCTFFLYGRQWSGVLFEHNKDKSSLSCGCRECHNLSKAPAIVEGVPSGFICSWSYAATSFCRFPTFCVQMVACKTKLSVIARFLFVVPLSLLYIFCFFLIAVQLSHLMYCHRCSYHSHFFVAMSILEVTTAVVQNGFTFSVGVIPLSLFFFLGHVCHSHNAFFML